MSREDANSGPVAAPVTDDVLTAFKNNLHPGPRAIEGQFHPDLMHPYTSKWNATLGLRVAEAMIADGMASAEQFDIIAKKFVNYVRTLQEQYFKEHPALDNRQNRAKTVFRSKKEKKEYDSMKQRTRTVRLGMAHFYRMQADLPSRQRRYAKPHAISIRI